VLHPLLRVHLTVGLWARLRGAAGGIMGWVKGKSPKSLGGGLSSAVILALAARSMAGATPLAGARVAFAGKQANPMQFWGCTEAVTDGGHQLGCQYSSCSGKHSVSLNRP
jgi:hypothetical protein